LHLSRQITSKKYAKTVNLLCAGNELFVKYQAEGGGFNPKPPPCVRPWKRLNSTHLQLRTKRYLQKTSSSNYWNINIQQPSNRVLQQLLKPDLPNKKRFYK